MKFVLLKLCIFASVFGFGEFLVNSVQGQGIQDLEGKVVVDGSSTVSPITIQAYSSFRKICPKVSVPVGVSGTGGGFKRFTKGETDISNASRPITFSELAVCRQHGVTFYELPVAYDGLTIAVPTDNAFVEQLTVEQLKKIFRADAKDKSFRNAKTWNEVDPSFPQTAIKIFAPGTDSGTFDYFKEVIADDEGSAIREDMSVSEDDNQLIQGIANTDGAIGFVGASYYFGNQNKLKAVKIINPKTGVAVEVSESNIESGDYAPFSRPLFIYINSQSAKRPEVKVFVTHYLQGAGKFAAAVQYVGLPESFNATVIDHFRRRQTGTHFWLEDGSRREGSLTEIYTKENLLQ